MKKARFHLLLLCALPVFAQTHQHGTATTGDGQFNPFVTADARGGFYLAYIERANNASNVARARMLVWINRRRQGRNST